MSLPFRVWLIFVVVWALPPLSAMESTVPVEPESEETVITSTSLEMESHEEYSVFIFRENVHLVGNNLEVFCDHLEVQARKFSAEEAPFAGMGRVSLILAKGNVVIRQAGRVARAGRAEVRPLEDIILLTENPEVVDAAGRVTGDRIIYNRGEQRIYAMGGAGQPVRVTVPRLPDLGGSTPPPSSPPVVPEALEGEEGVTPSPDSAPAVPPARPRGNRG